MKIEYNAINLHELLKQRRWSEKKFHWLHCYDESLCELLRREVKKSDNSQEQTLLVKGADLNLAWIEDNLNALTLFADDRPIVITNALGAKKDILKKLFEAMASSSKQISLYSSGKNDIALIKDYLQYEQHSFIDIKAPAFWDFDKLILSIFKLKEFQISPQIARFLGARLGQDIHEILNALSICSLNFRDKKLNLKEVEEIFKSSRHIDRFRLAQVFNQKNMALFFKELLECEVSLEEFRSFFSFMSGHCAKVIDPSYSQSKKKLSSYDKDIIAASRIWNSKQIDFMLEKLSNWTIACKKREDIRRELEATYFLFMKKSLQNSRG